jgi:hypothetical protein
MKFVRKSSVAVVLPLASLIYSCGGDSPVSPKQPVAAASPTPAPSPSPSPSLGKPPVTAKAYLFGYTRREGSNQGRFPIPPMPSTFQIGDAIDITCEARDEDGRVTNNIPDSLEWYSSSGGDGVLILNYDYVWNEGDRWADQIEIRYLSRTGYIDVSCKLPGTNVQSPTIRIPVFGGIR